MAKKYELAQRIAASPWYIKTNILAPKAFTFRYFYYRIMRPLLKVNYRIFRLIKGVTPWTSQASIRILEQLLERGMTGFEYGSGMSTIFIAERIGHLTSIDHNEHWFHIVREKLKRRNVENVEYHCIPKATNSQKREYEVFNDFGLDTQTFQVRDDYHDYFTFITTFPKDHFDFILIDGRARVECTLGAICRLKEGGMLVLDNSDRERYRPIFRILADWPQVTSTTGLFDTTIWFKPVTK